MKLWGVFLFLLLLAGCSENVPYDAKLFKATEENCWPCQMYMQAFRAIDGVLDNSLEPISQNALIILKLGLIFWLLFKIGSLFFSFAMPDIKKELPAFLSVFFKAGLVAIFLHNPSYIYDFFGTVIIQPFGKGFLSLSDSILESTSELGIDFDYNSDISGIWDNFWNWIKKIAGISTGTSSSVSMDLTSKMFGGLAKSVMETVFKIYHALWSGVGLGFQLWTMKGWSAFIAGFILIFGMFSLVIKMPLSFVDAFVRIGLILILIPLLMVGWVFSFPKDIVKKLFHNVLAGFFDILFACIYITFLISLFRIYEQEELPYLFSSSVQTTEGAMRTIGNEFGTDFLILTILAWSMVRLAGKIQDFSGYFFESAGKSVVYDMINKFKGLAAKGIRVGVGLAFGAAGWATAAKEAANAAKDAAKKEDKAE